MNRTLTKNLARLAGVGALGASLVYSGSLVGAADHLDAPGVQSDGRTDINDLYAFRSPTNPDNTVLILTVNPGAGVISGTTFDPKATYNFNIDQNGDAIADRTLAVDFKEIEDGRQRFKVKLDKRTVAQGEVGETSEIRKIGGSVTAGVFDDPFFFDLVGFNNGFNFTGDDFFAGLNVSAIVIEVPSSELSGDPAISVWATTNNKKGAQIDRIGRPAINTVLIPSNRKDEFNRSSPAGDQAAFGAQVQATIESLNGGDTATAEVLTSILLPDVLTFSTNSYAGFLNGRQLADDVIDAELGLLTNGALATDGVGANDAGFPGTFPYLAPAN